MKIAVIGATGYVGGRLVPELLAAGHTVRCLARNPDRLARVDWRSDVVSQDPDWAGGTIYEDIQEVTTSANTIAVFATVTGVGGARGWYVANPLWAIRGWLDKVIGGVGMRRGRRHPDELHVGEPWTSSVSKPTNHQACSGFGPR